MYQLYDERTRSVVVRSDKEIVCQCRAERLIKDEFDVCVFGDTINEYGYYIETYEKVDR